MGLTTVFQHELKFEFSDDSVILNQMEEASEQIPLMTTQNPSIEKLTEEISKMEFEMRRKSKEIKVMKSTEKVTRTKESFQKIESPRRREKDRREPQRRGSSRKHRNSQHKTPRNIHEPGITNEK